MVFYFMTCKTILKSLISWCKLWTRCITYSTIKAKFLIKVKKTIKLIWLIRFLIENLLKKKVVNLYHDNKN